MKGNSVTTLGLILLHTIGANRQSLLNFSAVLSNPVKDLRLKATERIDGSSYFQPVNGYQCKQRAKSRARKAHCRKVGG